MHSSINYNISKVEINPYSDFVEKKLLMCIFHHLVFNQESVFTESRFSYRGNIYYSCTSCYNRWCQFILLQLHIKTRHSPPTLLQLINVHV